MEAGQEKVETSVQDIADDLIKLYAEREASKGYAFSPDHEMQREFESAFPYQETDDQAPFDSRNQKRHGKRTSDGPLAVRRCGLR